MIHQFVELGQFFLQRERVSDPLAQYAQDPSQKARGNTVLMIVFGPGGFLEIRIEEFDLSKRLHYLYREGPSNGFEPTPTTRMASWDSKKPESFHQNVRKRLRRLAASALAAKVDGLPEWEMEALDAFAQLTAVEDEILEGLRQAHGDPKVGATLTVAWATSSGQIKRVGEFQAFQRSLAKAGTAGASKMKTIGEVTGQGTCSTCGITDVAVSGILRIPNFKFYTLDKPGSVSGGFDRRFGWRNFPVCRNCASKADFAGEWVKKELSFDYYGRLKYLVLPLPIRQQPTTVFDALKTLVNARLNRDARKRLTSAEDEILYAIAQEENLLEFDLLFYEPNQNYFRPSLYVSGLLPSRFRRLFAAKDQVDGHAWLNSPGPKAFTEGEFSFGSLRNVFPARYGGATFDDDFLEATRCALELRQFPVRTMLHVGMRWVRTDFVNGKASDFRLADLFRSILFFECLIGSKGGKSQVNINYGDSEQAERVRAVFADATASLRDNGAAQAAFLVGACCARIEWMQRTAGGSASFIGKYKGLMLTPRDIEGLFVKAKSKAQQYGDQEERKLAPLLACAASALTGAPPAGELSPDEASYYFALGHTLSARLGKRQSGEDNE
jgi:CRISPR-associated protein Csh1